MDEVLKEDRKSAQGLGLRGIIQWREGFLSDALRDCERAVEIDPQDSMLHKFYGIVLHARKRQDDATQEMRRAVELDPADAGAKLNLAILLATARPHPELDDARRFDEEAGGGRIARPRDGPDSLPGEARPMMRFAHHPGPPSCALAGPARAQDDLTRTRRWPMSRW